MNKETIERAKSNEKLVLPLAKDVSKLTARLREPRHITSSREPTKTIRMLNLNPKESPRQKSWINFIRRVKFDDYDNCCRLNPKRTCYKHVREQTYDKRKEKPFSNIRLRGWKGHTSPLEMVSNMNQADTRLSWGPLELAALRQIPMTGKIHWARRTNYV